MYESNMTNYLSSQSITIPVEIPFRLMKSDAFELLMRSMHIC